VRRSALIPSLLPPAPSFGTAAMTSSQLLNFLISQQTSSIVKWSNLVGWVCSASDSVAAAALPALPLQARWQSPRDLPEA
jgi:hypothetical protein